MRKGKQKIIFWLTLGIFVVVQVFFAVETLTLGSKLAKFEAQSSVLTQENQELSDELVKGTSLSAIGQSAEKLGFSKPQKTIFINTEETVAKTP